MLAAVYGRSGRYRQQAEVMHRMEALHPWHPHPMLDMQRKLAASLSRYGEQSVSERRFSSIRYVLASSSRIVLPVSINGRAANYAVDTGSDMSFLSEGEARRLGLAMRKVTDRIGTTAGKLVKTRLAIADSFVVGNIWLRHVAFWVVSDDHSDGDVGIIGMNVLLAFETIRWSSDGMFEIGFPPQPRSIREANLCFYGGQPVTEARFGRSNIALGLDTATDDTDLYPRFAREFDHQLDESGEKSTHDMGNFGTRARVNSVNLPEVALRVGDFDAVKRRVHVLLKIFWSSPYHGNLGLDLLNQAHRVTLDFTAMRLTLEGGGPPINGSQSARHGGCDLPPGFNVPQGRVARVSAPLDGSKECRVEWVK